MKKNVIIIVLAVVVSINLVLNIFNWETSKRVAYVRSQELVYGYDGMKEMQLKFQDQAKIWESRLDTLKMEYQRSLSAYQAQIAQLSKEEKIAREQLLRAQQNNFVQYSQSITNKSEEQEQKMLEGVLNQVNSFVEGYGKEKGYDLIFGTTLSGNILYGEEAIDITEEVITAINENYEGK